MTEYSMWDTPTEEITQQRTALGTSLASAAVEPLWPYLSQAKTSVEFEHRLALSDDALTRLVGQVITDESMDPNTFRVVATDHLRERFAEESLARSLAARLAAENGHTGKGTSWAIVSPGNAKPLWDKTFDSKAEAQAHFDKVKGRTDMMVPKDIATFEVAEVTLSGPDWVRVTGSKTSARRTAGWLPSGGEPEDLTYDAGQDGEGYVRVSIGSGDAVEGYDWWARDYESGREHEGRAFSIEEAKGRVEEFLHGASGLFEASRKTANWLDAARAAVEGKSFKSVDEAGNTVPTKWRGDEVDPKGGIVLDMTTANMLLTVHDALSPEKAAQFANMPIVQATEIGWKLVSKTSAKALTREEEIALIEEGESEETDRIERQRAQERERQRIHDNFDLYGSPEIPTDEQLLAEMDEMERRGSKTAVGENGQCQQVSGRAQCTLPAGHSSGHEFEKAAPYAKAAARGPAVAALLREADIYDNDNRLVCPYCDGTLRGDYHHVECDKCGNGYDPKSLMADLTHADGPMRGKVLRIDDQGVARAISYTASKTAEYGPLCGICGREVGYANGGFVHADGSADHYPEVPSRGIRQPLPVAASLHTANRTSTCKNCGGQIEETGGYGSDWWEHTTFDSAWCSDAEPSDFLASLRVGTRYCPTHEVYVGEGNQEQHDHCPVETRKKQSAVAALLAEADGPSEEEWKKIHDDLIEERNREWWEDEDTSREAVYFHYPQAPNTTPKRPEADGEILERLVTRERESEGNPAPHRPGDEVVGDPARVSTHRQAVNESAYGTERYQSQPEVRNPDWVHDAWDENGDPIPMHARDRENPFSKETLERVERANKAARQAAFFNDGGPSTNSDTLEGFDRGNTDFGAAPVTQPTTTRPRVMPTQHQPPQSPAAPVTEPDGETQQPDPMQPSTAQRRQARVARLTQRVLTENPTMGREAARALAERTVAKYPEMVKGSR